MLKVAAVEVVPKDRKELLVLQDHKDLAELDHKDQLDLKVLKDRKVK